MYTQTVPIGVVSGLYGAGPSIQPVLIQDVVCSGSERSISECNHNEAQLCPHSNDAAVVCEGLYRNYWSNYGVYMLFNTIAPPGSCSDGDIRLSSKNSSVNDFSANGTIEVCYTGVWGAVCAYGHWDEADNTVACRQLGYDNLS